MGTIEERNLKRVRKTNVPVPEKQKINFFWPSVRNENLE